jgi:hypothetical protein
MQGAEERQLRRMKRSNTPQGGVIEGNAADDALMVDQAGKLLTAIAELIMMTTRSFFRPEKPKSCCRLARRKSNHGDHGEYSTEQILNKFELDLRCEI